MIRLLMLLGAGIYGVMLIAGTDDGQQRLGLTGAYAPPRLPATPAAVTTADAAAVVDAPDLPAPAILVTAPGAEPARKPFRPAPQPVATASLASKAVYTPAQPVMETPVFSFAALTEAPAAVLSDTVTDEGSAELEAALPAEEEDAGDDIRRVLATAINVRSGPSASDPVVGRLTKGEEVLVVADSGSDGGSDGGPGGDSGWLHIRIEGDGVEGYVAARLLGAPTP